MTCAVCNDHPDANCEFCPRDRHGDYPPRDAVDDLVPEEQDVRLTLILKLGSRAEAETMAQIFHTLPNCIHHYIEESS